MHAQSALAGKYRILESSRLFLKGSSNVNTFTCHCEEKLPDRKLNLLFNGEQTEARFSETLLVLHTTSFDCGNKAMNRDLYHALKSDNYPEIGIEVLKVKNTGKTTPTGTSKEWLEWEAEVNIRIAGVNRLNKIKVILMKTGPNAFLIRGSKTLRMTDFKIDPPAPFFGMIKVRDEITIHLDLQVQPLLPQPAAGSAN